ncbi:MAG: transglutaminase domain-containing protein [Gemmatimonadales bacterium]
MRVGVLNRRVLAQFVLLAWAGSLAWLARREYGKDESATIAEATVRLNPEANFFAVRAGSRQIGYASVTVDTIPGGFRLTEVMALDVPEADSVRRVTRRTDVILSRSLRLRSFNRALTGGGLYEEFAGTIEGDTLLRMAQRDSRERPADEWTIRLAADVVLPEVLPYRLAFGKRLEVGRTVSANVLDLTTGTINRIEFAATAESTFVVADSAVEQRPSGHWRPVTWDTVKAWRIEHAALGTPQVDWVDRNGGLVSTEAALGLRLERSAFEVVSFNYRIALDSAGPGEHRQVPAMTTLVEANVAPPAGGAERAYRIENTPVERFLMPRLAWLAGGRQAARDAEVRVGLEPAARDSTKSDFLAPAAAIHPVPASVAAAAAAIAPSESDPVRVAGALAKWVAATVRRDAGMDAPLFSAHVLESGRGGAEGMTELFVDLARARGLTARRVGGVAVIRGRNYGHTWAEILVSGQWHAVDPTFGQLPASPTLVRVAPGGTGRAIDLLPFMGSATFAPATTVTDR